MSKLICDRSKATYHREKIESKIDFLEKNKEYDKDLIEKQHKNFKET